MISLIFIALVLLGVFFQFKKFRVASYTLYVVTVFLFVSIGCGPFAYLVLQKQSDYDAMTPPNWGHKNIIILLGSGVEKIKGSNQMEPHVFSYGRITKSAELYNACKKTSMGCHILISGGDPWEKGGSEAAIYGSVLTHLGVPSSDLILEDKSKNTWQNAQLSSEIINKSGADNVVLVTSGIHMERTLLYFSHFGFIPVPVRADYLSPLIKLIPNFYNLTLTDLAISEQVGIARYYLYNYLGWNSKPVPIRKNYQRKK